MAEATDDRLRLLIERVERLEEEKKGISDDIRDVYAEAKAVGYDAKIMRQIVKLRKMKPDDRAEMERRIELVRRHARAAGVIATSFVWHGDPAEAILEAAWTERPDVVVVGARHNRWIARLLGSVSGKVAEESPCRVEIVPG